jgi:hypothetical protein
VVLIEIEPYPFKTEDVVEAGYTVGEIVGYVVFVGLADSALYRTTAPIIPNITNKRTIAPIIIRIVEKTERFFSSGGLNVTCVGIRTISSDAPQLSQNFPSGVFFPQFGQMGICTQTSMVT